MSGMFWAQLHWGSWKPTCMHWEVYKGSSARLLGKPRVRFSRSELVWRGAQCTEKSVSQFYCLLNDLHLNIFKMYSLYSQVHSHYCATNTTTQIHNSFHLQNWNSVPIEWQLPIPLPQLLAFYFPSPCVWFSRYFQNMHLFQLWYIPWINHLYKRFV